LTAPIPRQLRALAEAENARRRAERTTTDARQFAVADFSHELLDVSDHLQRAVAAAEHVASTPATRLAAASASYFCVSLRTKPASVTTPFLTDTAMSRDRDRIPALP